MMFFQAFQRLVYHVFSGCFCISLGISHTSFEDAFSFSDILSDSLESEELASLIFGL